MNRQPLNWWECARGRAEELVPFLHYYLESREPGERLPRPLLVEVEDYDSWDIDVQWSWWRRFGAVILGPLMSR